MKEAILIINPTASPFYLAQNFKKNNFVTICCYVNPDNIYPLIRSVLEEKIFDHTVFLKKEFEEDIESIKNIITSNQLAIKLAFSSSEYELGYADKIANYFCPKFTNSPLTSEWRSNKHYMNQRLIENKLSAAKQHLITNISEVNCLNQSYPLVIKPAQGGGASIGVAICKNAEELENYCKNAHKIEWAYGMTPQNFLIEEQLLGEEYIIDIVAWNQKYYLIGIYYAHKEPFGTTKVCRHREYLSHHAIKAKQLYNYCSEVLKSLDVQFGMMHLECIFTKNGPVLIELNPRVSGVSGMLNYFSKYLIEQDQADLFIKLLTIENFEFNLKSIQPKEGVVFYLQNFGYKYSRVKEELFKSVVSYQKHLVKIPIQKEPTYPSNLLDTVAFVILGSTSRNQIENDLAQLKKLEAEGAFFE
jgi:biotin carboxylase